MGKDSGYRDKYDEEGKLEYETWDAYKTIFSSSSSALGSIEAVAFADAINRSTARHKAAHQKAAYDAGQAEVELRRSQAAEAEEKRLQTIRNLPRLPE